MGILIWIEQKKKEEEKAKEKELNDLFKVAVSQPKVPVGMYVWAINFFDFFGVYVWNCVFVIEWFGKFG